MDMNCRHPWRQDSFTRFSSASRSDTLWAGVWEAIFDHISQLVCSSAVRAKPGSERSRPRCSITSTLLMCLCKAPSTAALLPLAFEAASWESIGAVVLVWFVLSFILCVGFFPDSEEPSRSGIPEFAGTIAFLSSKVWVFSSFRGFF